MYFPSAQCRQRFYDLILEMTVDQEGMFTDLDADQSADQIKVKRKSSFFQLYVKRIQFNLHCTTI